MRGRVLIVVTDGNLSGASINATQVANLMSSRGYRVDFVSGPGEAAANKLSSSVNVLRQDHNLTSSLDLMSFLRHLQYMKTLLSVGQYDIVNTHSSVPGLSLKILRRLLPDFFLIHTVHGWPWRGKGRLAAFLLVAAERLVKDWPDQLIFVSDGAVKEGQAKLGEFVDYKVIHCPADRPKFGSPVVVRPSGAETFNLLMIARVDPAKDHHTLFRAFCCLDETYFLHLVGYGTDAPAFIEGASKFLSPGQLSRVTFWGERDDIQEFYGMSDVVVLLSHFETLPLVLLEAISMQKPVVATDLGSVRELIDNGDNGFLVQRESVAGVVEAINGVRMGSLQRVGWLSPKFEMSTYVTEILQVFDRYGGKND